jgi:hypothetical protein
VVKDVVNAARALDGFTARANNEIDWAFKHVPDEMISAI